MKKYDTIESTRHYQVPMAKIRRRRRRCHALASYTSWALLYIGSNQERPIGPFCVSLQKCEAVAANTAAAAKHRAAETREHGDDNRRVHAKTEPVCYFKQQ